MKKRMAIISALAVLFITSALVVSCPQNLDDVKVDDASSMVVEFTKGDAESDKKTLNFSITGATVKDASRITVSKEATVTSSNVTVTPSGDSKILSVDFTIGANVEITDAGKYTINIPETALNIDSTHKYPATAITKVVTVKVNLAE